MLGTELTSEEQLIKESVDRFIQRDYAFEHRRAAVDTELGFTESTWQTFAELGWLALTLPENAGGFAGGARQTAMLMEAFGRGLVTEPYLASIVLAGNAIRFAGAEGDALGVLEAAGRGELRLALAYAEPNSRYDVCYVETKAERTDAGFRLNGYKAVVINGANAQYFVVSARTAGEVFDEHGVSLFLVPADHAGVGVRGYATNDGGRAAEVTLDNIELGKSALIGQIDGAYVSLERAIDCAAAALCAEALGVMTVLNQTTLDYSKTREQFGQPIGKNQAVAHRLVDMFVALEESRSLLEVYMGDVDSDDREERVRAVSAMKIQVGKAGRLVGQEAIQLHGGIGMTDEYVAGHYFKRLTVITRLFGDLDWHLDRFASLSE